jgi:hypothetical protein
MAVCACHSSKNEKHKNRSCQGLPGQKKQEVISKIAKEKRVGGMAQVTQHLPSSAKTQNSRPSTANPSPSQKPRNYCINTHRFITVSNMQYKQFIKRENTTECLLPEKLKGFQAFMSIKHAILPTGGNNFTV